MKTDRPHILCVNPWIHDFAAFDFWLKPMGLLLLAARLRSGGVLVSFLDCLDRFHPKEKAGVPVDWDGRGPFRKTPIPLEAALPPLDIPLPRITKRFSRYGIRPEWFLDDLEVLRQSPGPPDLILVTSLMTYWASGVAETIRMIRKVFRDTPIVLGGRYASLFPDHARTHSGADLVIAGHGEDRLPAVVKAFTGFSLPPCSGSPPPAALDLCTRLSYAPLLTTRGCPFSCDYCASSFLEPSFTRRPVEQVFREIAFWHNRFGVKNFALYDDAFLIDGPGHAYPLLERIIASGMDLFFHTPNALHIREISSTAANLMFRAGFKNIRLGLETDNFSPSRPHDKKVTAQEFSRAVAALKTAGFTPDEVGAYLLCGLPGQDLDRVETAVRFVRGAGIRPVLAYFTPIPHTPIWEKAVRHARMPITSHPLFTNNSLFPCVNPASELDRILRLKNL